MFLSLSSYYLPTYLHYREAAFRQELKQLQQSERERKKGKWERSKCTARDRDTDSNADVGLDVIDVAKKK